MDEFNVLESLKTALEEGDSIDDIEIYGQDSTYNSIIKKFRPEQLPVIELYLDYYVHGIRFIAFSKNYIYIQVDINSYYRFASVPRNIENLTFVRTYGGD